MPKSILEIEIFEQPQILQGLLEQELALVGEICAALQGTFDYVIIAARGTSDNAARYAKYTLGAFNQLQVALATPSLFTLYDRPPNMQRALVIGISQSGQSPDIVSVLTEASQQNCPTLTITNYPDSPLGRAADHVIALNCNVERAICATKTYTTSLMVIAMLSAQLAGDQERLAQLPDVPVWMQQTLEICEPVMVRAERYRYMQHCAVIGRGYNYATAFECGLKIQELTGVVAEPYSSADFRHGPIAMVDGGAPVLVVAPQGSIYMDMIRLVKEVKARNGDLMIISDDANLGAEAQFYMPLVAGIPEWLTPMVTVLPGQLFSMNLAATMGFDVDRPHGLSKVTETW